MKYLKRFNDAIQYPKNKFWKPGNIFHTIETLRDILQELDDEDYNVEILSNKNCDEVSLTISKRIVTTKDVSFELIDYSKISNIIQRCYDYMTSEGCRLSHMFFIHERGTSRFAEWDKFKQSTINPIKLFNIAFRENITNESIQIKSKDPIMDDINNTLKEILQDLDDDGYIVEIDSSKNGVFFCIEQDDFGPPLFYKNISTIVDSAYQFLKSEGLHMVIIKIYVDDINPFNRKWHQFNNWNDMIESAMINKPINLLMITFIDDYIY